MCPVFSRWIFVHQNVVMSKICHVPMSSTLMFPQWKLRKKDGVFNPQHHIVAVQIALNAHNPACCLPCDSKMDILNIKIVSLHSPTNGHLCTRHACHGKQVAHRNMLRLVAMVVEILGKLEAAVKCVKVVAGADACLVAFVPYPIASLDCIKNHTNKFVMVKKVCEHLDDDHKRMKHYKNLGMVSVIFLDENVGCNK